MVSGAVVIGRGSTTVNVLPLPGVLATEISPPIRLARLRDISSPKPVPPNRRDVLSSPWVKRLNSLDRVAASMPMPSSLTSSRRG